LEGSKATGANCVVCVVVCVVKTLMGVLVLCCTTAVHVSMIWSRGGDRRTMISGVTWQSPFFLDSVCHMLRRQSYSWDSVSVIEV